MSDPDRGRGVIQKGVIDRGLFRKGFDRGLAQRVILERGDLVRQMGDTFAMHAEALIVKYSLDKLKE